MYNFVDSPCTHRLRRENTRNESDGRFHNNDGAYDRNHGNDIHNSYDSYDSYDSHNGNNHNRNRNHNSYDSDNGYDYNRDNNDNSHDTRVHHLIAQR